MVPSQPDAAVLDLLAGGELHLHGFLTNASNHTLLVGVGEVEGDVLGVYKPRAGERPLWDFPTGTLCQREVAAYLVSEALGWQIVPPTVLRDGPMGEGSLQLFVNHDPAEHYFTLVEDSGQHEALARIALFDLLINNADRKGSHILRERSGGRLLGIDHGLTFHPQPKLRTVVWDLGDRRLPTGWREDLHGFAAALGDPTTAVRRALAGLLSDHEREALERRALALADLAALPPMPPSHRAYPWPPL